MVLSSVGFGVNGRYSQGMGEKGKGLASRLRVTFGNFKQIWRGNMMKMTVDQLV